MEKERKKAPGKKERQKEKSRSNSLTSPPSSSTPIRLRHTILRSTELRLLAHTHIQALSWGSPGKMLSRRIEAQPSKSKDAANSRRPGSTTHQIKEQVSSKRPRNSSLRKNRSLDTRGVALARRFFCESNGWRCERREMVDRNAVHGTHLSQDKKAGAMPWALSRRTQEFGP